MVKSPMKHVRGRPAVRNYLVRTMLLATVGVAWSVPMASAGTLRSFALTSGGSTSLLIPGITGSGTPKGPDFIAVLSWSWGAHNNIGSQSSGAGAGRESSAPSVSEIVITKAIDKASPVIWRNCVKGTHFATVTLYMDAPPSSTGAPAGDTMTVTMSNTTISGFSLSSGGDRPTESVSFNFSKIKVDYTPQGGAMVHFGYDLKTHKLS